MELKKDNQGLGKNILFVLLIIFLGLAISYIGYLKFLEKDSTNNDLNNETLKSNKVSFEVKKNYDFKLSDLTVKEVNQENIVLTFTSSNASNKYYVKSVVINGESYDVKEREGNTYTVNIPNTYKEPLSLVTLTLTEATLDDDDNLFDLIDSMYHEEDN